MDGEDIVKRIKNIFLSGEVDDREAELATIKLSVPAEDRKIINELINSYKKADKLTIKQFRADNIAERNPVKLVQNDEGGNKSTIDNFVRIMLNDKHYSGMFFNEVRNQAEIHILEDKEKGVKAEVRRWTDTDDAESQRYIENTYNLYDPTKHTAALRLAWRERAYNPITDIIDNLVWDGIPRCEEFLIKWGKANDDEYTRECSRLIFADGIHRLYEPGCKVDDVIVFVGKQGAGKSSLVKFLAINDDFKGEVKTVEGDKSVEQLEGKWICEIAELFAVTKQKDQEAVKAFITRQRDVYRKPYDKHPVEHPRRCVLIGTTNSSDFLIDKTGNRRWFPVKVHCDGYDLGDHEAEIREYVLQCWAEAKAKLGTPAMQNYARRELMSEYQKHQDEAMQDDWRVGAIGEYLSHKHSGDFVCARELMQKALSPDSDHKKDPTLQDSKAIGQIMAKDFPEWEKVGRVQTEDYGRQRCWQLKRGYVDDEEDDLPL